MANILQTAPANLTGVPIPEFDRNQFDGAVFAKGYDVILEKALRCPCGEHPLPNCQNCNGVGFFYINATETKAIITGIDVETKYKEWTAERLGMIGVTVRNEDKPNVSYYDRVTIKDEYSYFTESKRVLVDDITNNGFLFLTYKPIEVLSVHYYIASDRPLHVLAKSQYQIKPGSPYCIEVDSDLIPENGILSVYYKHEPEFHVIDIPHEIRASWVQNAKGSFDKEYLPVQAYARRSHLCTDQIPNFDGTGIIFNANI